MVSDALLVCRASVFKCNITGRTDREYLTRLSSNQKGDKSLASRRLLQDESDPDEELVTSTDHTALLQLEEQFRVALGSIESQKKEISSLRSYLNVLKNDFINKAKTDGGTAQQIRQELDLIKRNLSASTSYGRQEVKSTQESANHSSQDILARIEKLRNESNTKFLHQSKLLERMNATLSASLLSHMKLRNSSLSGNALDIRAHLGDVQSQLESLKSDIGNLKKLSTQSALSKDIPRADESGLYTLKQRIGELDARLTQQQYAQTQITSLLAHVAFVKTQQCNVIESVSGAIRDVVNQCGTNVTKSGMKTSVCAWYSQGCIKYLLARMKAILLVQMINIRRSMRQGFFVKLNKSDSETISRRIEDDVNFEDFLPNKTSIDYIGSLKRVLNNTDFLTASDADDIIELFLCVQQSVYEFLGNLCNCYTQAGANADLCKCSSGRYYVPRSRTCERCARGMFFPSRSFSPSCMPCPAGKFQDDIGATDCKDCLSGHYSTQAGSTSCSRCEDGTKSRPGATSCSKCESFELWDNGSKSCRACNAGEFRNGTSCTLCGVNSFSRHGAMLCTACPAGTFSPPGSSECVKCVAGTYRDSQASICQSCGVGSFSAAGSSVCTQCGPGTYSNQAGSSMCHDCQPGYISSSPGRTSCSSCSQGSFSVDWRQSACTLCSAGSYSNQEGQNSLKSCLLCRAGTFSTQSGANSSTSCIKCPLGSFASMEGKSSCETCQSSDVAERVGSSKCLPFSTIVVEQGRNLITWIGAKAERLISYTGLVRPFGVYFAGDGSILVADRDAQQISQVDEFGKFVQKWNVQSPVAVLEFPHWLGSRFVAVTGSTTTAVLSQDQFLPTWTGRNQRYHFIQFLKDDASQGSGLLQNVGQILDSFDLSDIRVAPSGLLVVDSINHVIMWVTYAGEIKLKSTVKLLSPISAAICHDGSIVVSDSGNKRVVWVGIAGDRVDNEVTGFVEPAGLDIVDGAEIVVVDRGAGSLVWLSRLGRRRSVGGLKYPQRVSVRSSDGLIVVSDLSSLVVFSREGVRLRTIGGFPYVLKATSSLSGNAVLSVPCKRPNDISTSWPVPPYIERSRIIWFAKDGSIRSETNCSDIVTSYMKGTSAGVLVSPRFEDLILLDDNGFILRQYKRITDVVGVAEIGNFRAWFAFDPHRQLRPNIVLFNILTGVIEREFELHAPAPLFLLASSPRGVVILMDNEKKSVLDVLGADGLRLKQVKDVLNPRMAIADRASGGFIVLGGDDGSQMVLLGANGELLYNTSGFKAPIVLA
jgi:hypothetical protein